MIARRGIIHVHSRYSYDGLISLRTLLRLAVDWKLDFLILTDHDTVQGARELSKLVHQAGIPVEVPLAAEYKTDEGDVIAAFIQEEIRTRSFRGLVKEVKAQGGLVLLPHPYHGHRSVERLAEQADLIEVFNGRIGADENSRAVALAKRLGKPVYYASDAHIASSLNRVVLAVNGEGELKQALLHGTITPEVLRRVSPLDLLVSQYVKAWRRRDPILGAYVTARWAMASFRAAASILSRKVPHKSGP